MIESVQSNAKEEVAQSYDMNELKTTFSAMLKLVENCFCFRWNDGMIKSNDKQTQDAAKTNSAAQDIAGHTVFALDIYSKCTKQFQRGKVLLQREQELSNGRESIFIYDRVWSLENESSIMWKNLHFNYVLWIFV